MLSCIIYILFCHLQYAGVWSFDRQIVINLSSVTYRTFTGASLDGPSKQMGHEKFVIFDQYLRSECVSRMTQDTCVVLLYGVITNHHILCSVAFANRKWPLKYCYVLWQSP